MAASGKGRVRKIRADQALVDRGLVETRSKAQALIMAGVVFSEEKRIDKPGQQITEETPLEVRGQDHPWVSRGGLKLEKGLTAFSVDPAGMVALDVGASTGGFTDVLLQNGAARVYAVDVGRGQLHWKLRTDERVVVLESTNARHLRPELVPDPIDIVVCDASFIGLEKVLPAALDLARPGAWLVALIKPQFQVGKGEVGKGGVVRDPDLHGRVCDEVAAWLSGEAGWQVEGIAESPITGPQGNVEFLIGARKPG
ncbi:TlyA family RNA methyltransferase [Hwanghaeella grinnelliae]|uniref:TlyA family RNA methyltransferase n=1 Tax=Hwanghaeella grinnelliae TaxID=2500179 RepID=A0A3S3UM38_9PROT|nr:TlyA family RNA methyltransferase [Hwanghaeella grinnelliae]RVU34734.1 TlyA family RNA methyltransferase [Hwanghaeella grinnelliae]